MGCIDARFGNKTVDFSELIFESVFSVYENKVLQLMSGGASLEKFGEKGLVFINRRSCRHCAKTNGL